MTELEAIKKIIDEHERRIAVLESNKLDKKKLKEYIDSMIKSKRKQRPRKPRVDGFEEVWAELPRGGRDGAERAYIKAIESGATMEQIISSIKVHKQVEWKGRPKDKIPHLSTFLNQGYHKTEIHSPQKKNLDIYCRCGRLYQDGDKKSYGMCSVCHFEQKKIEIENERAGE